MRSRFLITLLLVFMVIVVLYSTGALANVGLFLTFGFIPGTTERIEPLVMLALQAVLLLVLGYAFGFLHGTFYARVRSHLQRIEQQPKQVTPQPAAAQTHNQPKRMWPHVARMGIGLMTIVKLCRKWLVATHRANRPRIATIAHNLLQSAHQSTVWLRPRLARAAKIGSRLVAKGVKLLFDTAERAWGWLREK